MTTSPGETNGRRSATPFRGPYADGPPAAALEVDAPPLDTFHVRDVGRFVVVVAVLGTSVLRALAGRLVRRRATPIVTTACDGLVDGFIRLGPTFVKAGQILASSGALVPEPLVLAARRCLDAVPAFPGEQARAAVAEDLGRPVDEVFASFDDHPLSAASIGQVHACTLRDGREAVVKVQRPGIRDGMAQDLRNSYRIAWLFEKTPWGKASGARDIIVDLHAVTFQELNPVREAWQQDRFRNRIGAFGDNTMITAPEVYWDHCGPRTICMERVRGVPMDHFDELANRGLDLQLVVRRGAKVWAEAAMLHGPFHGDMHAGNIWVLDDGRGCFLDFGIMGELDQEWRDLLQDLFYTCAFDLDFSRVAAAYRRVGAIPEEFGDEDQLAAFLTNVLGAMLSSGFGGVDIAQLVSESVKMLKAYDASIPRELVLIAKQLLYIDRYTKHLAPDYSLTADPFIVKNVFPEEAAKKAADLGAEFPA
jgi:predicted unusual protein kinase regulating ubiquinone biosynthesis (AarF/ABC1/UbiB family)